MRFLAILFFLAILPGFSRCQVVLSAGDYPSVLTGIDTLRVTTAASLFPAFLTSTPGTWDMTVVADSATLIYTSHIVSSPSFGNEGEIQVGSYSTSAKHNFLLNSSEISLISEETNFSAIDLFSVTSGGADTFYILGQTALYSLPIREIAFPASSLSSWTSAGYVDIAFELSVATFFYLHEPGYLRTYIQRSDVVTNWGKMRVRDMSGAPSPYIDVLQVQTTTITTDSAFLSGGPMPAHIQLLLGITQGKSDTVYTHAYYRKGEVTPLAYVEFTDETFSHAVRAKTHVQRLTTAVRHTESEHAPSLYPNPASGIVNVEDPSGVFYNYCITDLSGRVLQSGNLINRTRRHSILLDGQLTNGFYCMRLTDSSGHTKTAGLIIEK